MFFSALMSTIPGHGASLYKTTEKERHQRAKTEMQIVGQFRDR